MDISGQRTPAERAAANLLDTNRDSKLSADELGRAFAEYVLLFPVRAASFEPPTPREFEMMRYVTVDSLKTDFAHFAKANARIFPGGIEPLSDTQLAELAAAARQSITLVQDMPEPSLSTKAAMSYELFAQTAIRCVHAEAEDLFGAAIQSPTPRGQLARTTSHAKLP